jgi:hypothetical protein
MKRMTLHAFRPKALNREINLAGLLAYAISGRPSHPTIGGQWLEVCRRLLIGIYSYGDSAGLTPDFPFNEPPDGGSTKFEANVGSLSKNNF